MCMSFCGNALIFAYKVYDMGPDICEQNLKMKISHPRLLCVGKQDELMKKIPACLERKTVAEQSGALGNSRKMPQALFVFPEVSLIVPPVHLPLANYIIVAGAFFGFMPFCLRVQDITVHGNTPLLWPLWFRAAVPGNISLLITIYYEIGNMSSFIKYRTLRMSYNLQVCA